MGTKWVWWSLAADGHGQLVALNGLGLELELWMGGGWTATRGRWRFAGRSLAWLVAGEA